MILKKKKKIWLDTVDRQREHKGKHWSTFLSCDNQERNKIGFAALLNQGELIQQVYV